MNWIQVSNTVKRVEAEWMATDVASRMRAGVTLAVRTNGGWQCWRTLNKGESWPDMMEVHPQPPQGERRAYSARRARVSARTSDS